MGVCVFVVRCIYRLALAEPDDALPAILHRTAEDPGGVQVRRSGRA